MCAMVIHHCNNDGGTECDYMLLLAFFLMLPFIYAAQVVGGHPVVGLAGYVPLILLSLVVMQDGKRHLHLYRIRPTFLSLLLLALVAHNAISGIGALLDGEVGIGGRVLCLFVLPYIVFVAGRRLSSKQHWGIVKIVTLTAVIIAAELAWESISIWILRESTWFQLSNRYYVLGQTGNDLGQLWWTEYRPTGLLEHVHTSTFYLVIGVAAGATNYLKTGDRKYLAAAVFCDLVLVAHGVRFALLTGMAASALLFSLIRWGGVGEMRDRIRRAAWWFVVATVLVLITDPFGTVSKFYIPAFLHGVWSPDNPHEVTVGAVVGKGWDTAINVTLFRLGSDVWSSEFFMGLFGHGIANSLAGNVVGLDDDFFVTQVFTQYGVIGGAGFYLIFAYAALQALRAMARTNADSALLLAFALTTMAVLAVSTLHSGIIQRKVMFALLFWMLAIICSCSALRGQDQAVRLGVPRGLSKKKIYKGWAK